MIQLLLEFVHADLRHAVDLLGTLSLRDAAELLVVDQLRNGRVLAADGAVRVLAELHLAEAHVQRVVQEEPSDERLADPEYELGRLCGLDGADGARQDAENSALGAGRDEAGRGWLGVEAAVARTFLGVEHARLTLEPEDRTVDVGLVQKDAGVVHQVPGREVVRAVDDHIIFLEDLQRVLAGERLLVDPDLDVGVYVLDLLVGTLDLGTTHVRGAMNDLALQIGLVDHVEVNDPDGPDPGRSQVQGERTPESARAYREYLRGLELFLTF